MLLHEPLMIPTYPKIDPSAEIFKAGSFQYRLSAQFYFRNLCWTGFLRTNYFSCGRGESLSPGSTR